MNSKDYLDEMKKIQINVLDYLNEKGKAEQKYRKIVDNINIRKDGYKLKSLLHLLLNISNNFHRDLDFFSKIERIIQFYKEDMTNYFSNSELFNIFKSNKRILLYLFDEKIIEMNPSIIKTITQGKFIDYFYPQYFAPEIKQFVNEEWFPEYRNFIIVEMNYWVKEIMKELPEGFYEKRKIGENDNYICQLIRNDSIKEFIDYVNENSYPLDSKIDLSIYETNLLLLEKNDFLSDLRRIELIEYAAFFGSIQIFNYLKENGVELSFSLCVYAIHSKDYKIIKIYKENDKFIIYRELFEESIKCHHNDIAIYTHKKYLDNNENEIALVNGLKYHNFLFIESGIINEKNFYDVCKYDYFLFAVTLLNNLNIDVNELNKVFLILYLFKILNNYWLNRILNSLL